MLLTICSRQTLTPKKKTDVTASNSPKMTRNPSRKQSSSHCLCWRIFRVLGANRSPKLHSQASMISTLMMIVNRSLSLVLGQKVSLARLRNSWTTFIKRRKKVSAFNNPLKSTKLTSTVSHKPMQNSQMLMTSMKKLTKKLSLTEIRTSSLRSSKP